MLRGLDLNQFYQHHLYTISSPDDNLCDQFSAEGTDYIWEAVKP